MRPATRPPGAAAGACAQQLAALLAPYADRDPTQAGRLVDVPPAVAAAALALLPPGHATTRLNRR